MQVTANNLIANGANKKLIHWFMDRFNTSVSFNNLITLANSQGKSGIIRELYRTFKFTGTVTETRKDKLWTWTKFVNGKPVKWQVWNNDKVIRRNK
jgi:hypothetical protein